MDSPCRYSSGRTSATLGLRRHQGGEITERPRPLAGRRVDAAVVDPRCAHWDRSGHGGNLTLAGVAVADHQPPAALVPLGGEGGQVGVDLGLQAAASIRLAPSRANRPGRCAAPPVRPRQRLHSTSRRHPPHRRCRAGLHLGWSSRRVRRALAQEADPQLQVIPPGELGAVTATLASTSTAGAQPHRPLKPSPASGS